MGGILSFLHTQDPVPLSLKRAIELTLTANIILFQVSDWLWDQDLGLQFLLALLTLRSLLLSIYFTFCPLWGGTTCTSCLWISCLICLCGWCLFAMCQLLDTFCPVYRTQSSQQLLEESPGVLISPSVISVLFCAFIAWSFLRSWPWSSILQAWHQGAPEL